MSNALNPELMTPAERLAQIARILAVALVRLHGRKSSETVGSGGESFVDFSPAKSGHAPEREKP
jgi:hypothetical protein